MIVFLKENFRHAVSPDRKRVLEQGEKSYECTGYGGYPFR